MASFVAAGDAGDWSEGEGRRVEVGGKALAIFRIQGEFLAIDAECRHRGGPLHEGEVAGCTVVCPWHGWEYDLKTGADHAERTKVACYAVRVEGGRVEVELP